MIAITGATGQLGTLVIEALLKTVPADQIIAAVRTTAKATTLAAKGIQIREANYSRPETLTTAFAGVTKLLLISGTEVGPRVAQHKAVIDAAKAAGVQLLAYTSLLRADTSRLLLAEDHLATEQSLQASGIPFTLLRNGWYVENLTAGIAPALQQGAFIGASKDGRFAAATRADYAAAAAAVLTGAGHENKVYELGGDTPFTRAELAAEVSKQTGKAIGYHDLPEAEYEKILANFLPPEAAKIIADGEAKAADGGLDDQTHTLSRLIGRKTTGLAEAVADALKAS
ncbi:SDR family oxidoreductase [Terriglobus saanensis]|uniref:Male sterility domain protein n=1 Tax=Terriglobus saanensis (strain ATCC BAA-1853 / DSM 23119 / SP1PR4) TaxID=401053 RepID=E8UY49_TERSS|nr:SDR family oxidoreductase [Terriglobus saanensis]ADV80859.1 Male sterility domain protein [Terriglobus saanensis SP1PR4]